MNIFCITQIIIYLISYLFLFWISFVYNLQETYPAPKCVYVRVKGNPST